MSLSIAYAIGDALSLHHSLHRKPKEAEAFYAAPPYRWADVKTLLDIGFAVVRVVELAIPFA